MKNSADSQFMRSRIRGTTFCFKTLNDTNYNDSKVTFLGTKYRLSDTMKFYSKEFGVNMSHLLLGKL